MEGTLVIVILESLVTQSHCATSLVSWSRVGMVYWA